MNSKLSEVGREKSLSTRYADKLSALLWIILLDETADR